MARFSAIATKLPFCPLFLLLSLTFTSCSTAKKVAVGSTATLLYDASVEMESEKSWQTVQSSMLPNLKIIEGLLVIKPHDRHLLVSALKGYMGHAFMIDETLALEEKLKDQANAERSPLAPRPLEQAVYNYSKALDYGFRMLAEYDITLATLLSKTQEKGAVAKYLDDELKDNPVELETVLFTAQALGGLINLKKDELKIVAMAPMVKELFDWVCAKQPNINFGTCDLFYATYDVSRPKALGGNPEAGKQRFLSMFKQEPYNWLARTQFLEFYVIPMGDEEEFKNQMDFLSGALTTFQSHMMWAPKTDADNDTSANEEKDLGAKRLRLYQALALKRYELLNKYRKNLF